MFLINPFVGVSFMKTRIFSNFTIPYAINTIIFMIDYEQNCQPIGMIVILMLQNSSLEFWFQKALFDQQFFQSVYFSALK